MEALTLVVPFVLGGAVFAAGVALGTMLGPGDRPPVRLSTRRPERARRSPEEPEGSNAPVSNAKVAEAAGVAKAVEVGAQQLLAEYRAAGMSITPGEARRRAATMLGVSDGMDGP
jgi:hypothetical protein